MGFSVVTTVLSKAASYDLTDLATAKDELSIGTTNTSSDNWLGRAISQVSKEIATHTRRIFPPEIVQDMFDIQQDPYPYQTPGGFAQLQLSRWPVLGPVTVTQTIATGISQALTEGKDFRTDPATGQLLRLNPFTGTGSTWEALPAVATYAAGYGDLIAETATVPASSPFQVTVGSADAFSCDQAVAYAGGAALVRVAANPQSGQYAAAAGVYTFNEADADAAVAITYTVAEIPADLVGIALRLVTSRFMAKGRDPALVQRETPGVGTERFWFGGAPGQKGAFPPDIEAALDESYGMPVAV